MLSKIFTPEEWKINKLEDLLQIKYGKDQKQVICDTGKYKILGTGGVIGRTNSFLYDKPSILIGRKGTINKPMYIEEPFWTVDTLFYSIIKDGVFPKWLYYYITNINLMKYNEATGVPSLSVLNLNNISVLTPPLPEQQKIASILSSVDEAIEKTEQIIAKTEEVKKGLMQELLTKGIGHTEFKESEVGEIPVGWEVKRLSDIFEFFGGMPIPRSQLSNEGALYLHYGDIHKSNKIIFDTEIDKIWLPRIQTEKIKEDALLNNGDVVFADASEDLLDIGKSIVVRNEKNQFIAGLHTIVGKEKNNLFTLDYKGWCFKADYIRKQFGRLANGTTVYGISKTNIEKLWIPVPTKEEQKNISELLNSLESKIEIETIKVNNLKSIKQGLMQQLLTGQVRVKLD